MITTTRRLALFQAGGNMGGDCDVYGRPVADGRWYVVEGEPGLEAVITGGFLLESSARAMRDAIEEYGAEDERDLFLKLAEE